MHIIEAHQAATNPGPADWFTGQVWIEQIADAPPPSRLRASRVYFSAGARTAWHTHPVGQTLQILEGIARVRSDGGPARELSPGDVVTFDADERHWHGATPHRPMVHLALQDADGDGATAEWGEHVTDEQYRAPTARTGASGRRRFP
jgi:quercetin dioxygenase-like cupin family protein